MRFLGEPLDVDVAVVNLAAVGLKLDLLHGEDWETAVPVVLQGHAVHDENAVEADGHAVAFHADEEGVPPRLHTQRGSIRNVGWNLFAYALGSVYNYSNASFCPVASVEVAVADGLGDVVALDFLRAFKVGDGAGDL